MIDSSSIEVNRRRRRAKTDRLDLEGFASAPAALRGGGAQGPCRRARAERCARRMRGICTGSSARRDRTRVANRMQGLLANQGLEIDLARDVPSQLARMRRGSDFPKPCADVSTRSGTSPNAHACLATDRTTAGDTRNRTLSGANPHFLRRVYPVPRMSVGWSLGHSAIWQLAAELTPPRRLHAAIRREDRWVLRHRCQAASREEGRPHGPSDSRDSRDRCCPEVSARVLPGRLLRADGLQQGGRGSPMRQPWKQENAQTSGSARPRP